MDEADKDATNTIKETTEDDKFLSHICLYFRTHPFSCILSQTFNTFIKAVAASINAVPLNETDLVLVSGLIHQEVLLKWVNKESSTECHSYDHQVNTSPQLQCQDMIQYWLDKIRKAFSS